MYCLRVFIVVYRNYMYIHMYIVCYSVYCDYFGVLNDCCVSELQAKLCPHRNVWPEIVLQELHCLLHVFWSELLSLHQVSLLKF